MPGSKHPAVYINTLLEEKPVGCHLGMFYRRRNRVAGSLDNSLKDIKLLTERHELSPGLSGPKAASST